jgi:hypothetical protein
MSNDNAIGIAFITAPRLLTIRVSASDLGSSAENHLAELVAALDAAELLRPAGQVVVDFSNVRHFGARLTGIIAARAASWRRRSCRLIVRGDRTGIFAACGLDGLTATAAPHRVNLSRQCPGKGVRNISEVSAYADSSVEGVAVGHPAIGS